MSWGGDAPPARLGPAPLQHIYINVTSLYISLAEGAHQRGGGVLMIPQDGESAEGTEKLVTATAVILHNGFIPFLTPLFSFNPLS